MPTFVQRSEQPVSAGEAYAWHTRPGAFERMTPPWQRIDLVERTGSIAEGGRVVLALRIGPSTLRWETLHGPASPGRLYTSRQVRGPFDHWEHAHRFLSNAEGGCTLEDAVEYRLPFGAPGALLGGALARRLLARLFAFRHRRLADDLARHAAFAGRPPLRVAISGASGLVGRRLAHFLSAGGHTVLPLVRTEGPAPAGAGAIAWNPAGGTIDAAALAGVDAVVHLAGENIAAGRWSARRKRAIRDSRVDATALLARALAGLGARPRVLVCASAVGYYGDTGDRAVDEQAPPGSGFLAEVCRDWEAAAEPARSAGIRVAHLRTGMVLAGEGGVLARLRLPFRLGLGGPVGSGRQYLSWIALEDLLGVVLHALHDERLAGPVNAVAPQAVTSLAFARALGRVLGRPAVMPLPAAAVRAWFGEMGRALLLEGQRVLPARLRNAGFSHRYPGLEDALRIELGR
jgi:hypothetical protein